MEKLWETRGCLEIVFARGWLSAWEASHLETGGLVLGQTLAGAGADLCFEGRWMARGEVYVLGEEAAVFGFRISGLDREAREEPEPQRGEGLLDLLPLELVCGGADYRLGELGPASGGTILSLDSLVDAPCPITLKVAGLVAGRGRAVVDGENLGILLDETAPLGRPRGQAEVEVLSTGAYVPPQEREARGKLYDFRKPDRFTRRCIRALEGLHGRVAMDLGRRSELARGLKVAFVDQLTWGEWIEARKTGNAGPGRLYAATFGRPPRGYERGIWPLRTGRAYVQPEAAKYNLGSDIMDRVERMTADEEARLGDRPLFLDLGGELAELDPALFLSALRSAWRLLTDATFSSAREVGAPPVWRLPSDDRGGSAEKAGLLPDEMIALVDFSSPRGYCRLVYAARALYAHIKVLEHHERFAESR